eukprot:12739540-Ditylum_brightwellii.AAC.1
MQKEGRCNQIHLSFCKLFETFPMFAVCNQIVHHVSAKGLSSLNIPTLTQHHMLSLSDKEIWDNAYKEEYNGLEALSTW